MDQILCLAAEPRRKFPVDLVLPAVIAVALVVGQFLYIRTFGVNVPFWDEWVFSSYFVRFISGDLTLGDLLLAKHNEHLVGASFGVMLLFHLLAGFDSKAILYLGLALQIASLLLLLATARPLLPQGARRGWHMLLIALLMLSLAQSWNILWGFQTAWYLVTFFLLASLWMLSQAVKAQDGGTGWVAIGAAFALLASFSSIQGLAAWLAGAVFLLASSSAPKLRFAFLDQRLLVWIALALTGLTIYGWIFSLTPTPHSSSSDIVKVLSADLVPIARFALGIASTVWGDHLGARAVPAGAVVAFVCVGAAACALRSEHRQQMALPLALIAFGAVFVLMVTAGRFRMGEHAALESRYSAYVLLALVGVVLIAMRLTIGTSARAFASRIRIVLVLVVVGTFLSSALKANKAGRKWRLERGIAAMVLLDFESLPRLSFGNALCWDPDFVLRQAPLLKAHALSTFADGATAVPARSAIYGAPPAHFRDLIERSQLDRPALQRLWDVYVIGPELRDRFPVSSPSLAAELIGWAADSARGEHYLAKYLAEYANDYIRIRDAAAASPEQKR